MKIAKYNIGSIRSNRRNLFKKGNFSEALLVYSRPNIYLNWNYDNRYYIKDRKSQRRLLPPHLQLKKIPKAIEIKI